MAASSRASCLSHPGYAEAAQLNATWPNSRLAITCAPAENNFGAPPCIQEHFFHMPKGFEGFSSETLAEHIAHSRVDPFNQCRSRTRDEDWPTTDLHLTRDPSTKTMHDVMQVLGKRIVTMIGASLTRQTHAAMQCALESVVPGGRRAHELQWRQWGWGTFTVDNRGCDDVMHEQRDGVRQRIPMSPAQRVARLTESGCIGRGREFQALLDSDHADVVIVAYNPQHYEGSLDWWRLDLQHILPALQKFALDGAPNKVAVMREPAAQHFPGGHFVPSKRRWVSAASGCCEPLNERDAHDNFNWHATRILREEVSRLAPNVRILPWYNITLQRYSSHIGTRAACFEQQPSDGHWIRKAECSCDCTHFCYTPLFWDVSILTPLHQILKEARRPAGGGA